MVVFSLVLLSFIQSEVVMVEPKTIVVTTDYSTIQAAIDNTIDCNTVFVRNGVYQVDEKTNVI
jgi:pectin methylesterase-like acyl-CoA thioesterase